MNNLQMKKLLEERLAQADWNFSYDRESGKLRIEDKQTRKGITLSLPGVVAKWEARKEKAVDEVIYYIKEAMKAMTETHQVDGKEAHIFPVIRSTSFPKETKDGKRLIFEEHTAETRIYYAFDLGTTYRLIDEEFAREAGWEEERIKQVARFNVRSLDTSYKEDKVAGNTFYFVNSNDGYDASRILNDSLLAKMAAMAKGKLAIAAPHQDVLIFADIENDQGYDILAQLTMSFFAEGNIPITALPFLYENKQLEPIFILAKNKPTKK